MSTKKFKQIAILDYLESETIMDRNLPILHHVLIFYKLCPHT